MERKIQVEFSLDDAEFFERFENAIKIQPMFDVLIIINILSASKGLQLISQKWFESKFCSHDNLIGISLKIDGMIDNLPDYLDLFLKNTILIAFQSTFGGHESKTYWKIAGRDKFYVLDIDDDSTDDITSFCHEFLMNEIKNERVGM
jgi:hypothetical protein